MKDLEAVATKLRHYIEANPSEKDSHLVYEAMDIMAIKDWKGNHDSVEVCETDWLEYVLPDEEGDPTICVYEGQVYVGPIETVKADLNQKYAEKHSKTICKCCGSFERKRSGKADCEYCGNLVDAAECLTSKQIEEKVNTALAGFTELNLQVWLLKERLETHLTKKNASYVFLELTDMLEHEKDPDIRYYGEVKIVNIGMAGKKAVLAIKEECGIEGHVEPVWIAKELMWQGTCACVIQESGNSRLDVLERISKRMIEVTMLGGFALDRAQNAIGSTGWDLMKGDILAGLKRHQKTPAAKLMGKLMGIVADED